MEATVSIIHPDRADYFLVSITLPNGEALSWRLTRAKILGAAAEQIESVG
jgi:hypothetical protein